MAVEMAEKYSSVVDEVFTKEGFTAGIVNQNYEFDGVNTIHVYSVGTAPLNDYVMTGTNRYGTPAELDATTDTYVITEDKGFTYTIDKRHAISTNGVLDPTTSLARQTREVNVPYVDQATINKVIAGAGNSVVTVITNENAYETFLDAQGVLNDALVPYDGRIALVSQAYYKAIKMDDNFVKASDLAQDQIKFKGTVGMVDGVSIVLVPTVYLPDNVNFFITHPIATTRPTKLQELNTHDNPPGVSGYLVEGRFIFDAFVMKNKADAIYVSTNA